MTPTQLFLPAVILGAMGTAYVWQADDPRVRDSLAEMTTRALSAGSPAPESPVPPTGPTTHLPPPAQPTVVQRWTDTDGTVHFEQHAVATSTAYVAKPAGTMADYERALERQSGINARDLERARLGASTPATDDTGPAGTTSTVASTAFMTPASAAPHIRQHPMVADDDVASQQAYELMDRQQTAMETVRQLNGRHP